MPPVIYKAKKVNKLRTAIGLDVGGTNISGVLINESGEVLFSYNRASNYYGIDYEKNCKDRFHYVSG